MFLICHSTSSVCLPIKSLLFVFELIHESSVSCTGCVVVSFVSEFVEVIHNYFLIKFTMNFRLCSLLVEIIV